MPHAPQSAVVALVSNQRNEVTPITLLLDASTTIGQLSEVAGEAIATDHPHHAGCPIKGFRWFDRQNVVGA